MKKVLVIVLALVMVFCMFSCGEKQDEAKWPTEAITIICPYSISGGTGTMCNILADYLKPVWGVDIQVVEKAGASGTTGTAAMAISKPDGYTFMMTAKGALCLSPHTTGVPYAKEDVEMICQVSDVYTLLSTSTDHPVAANWAELLEKAKTVTGTDKAVTVSSSGNFGAHHVAVEALSLELIGKTGLFKHIPEDGGAAACTQCLGGHYDLVAGIISEQAKYFGLEKEGLKCMLQMTSLPAAQTDFPDVPTCGDLGITATGGTWYMIACPKGTPAEIKAIIEAGMKQALSDPDVIKKFEDTKNPVVWLGTADAQAKYEAEFEQAKVVCEAIPK